MLVLAVSLNGSYAAVACTEALQLETANRCRSIVNAGVVIKHSKTLLNSDNTTFVEVGDAKSSFERGC